MHAAELVGLEPRAIREVQPAASGAMHAAELVGLEPLAIREVQLAASGASR